jgi:hypothetical protein
MRDAGGKYDQGAWAGDVARAGDLEVHRPAQDEEELVDDVGVHAGRGTFAGWRLDAVDGAAGRARLVVEKRLGDSPIRGRESSEIDLAQVSRRFGRFIAGVAAARFVQSLFELSGWSRGTGSSLRKACPNSFSPRPKDPPTLGSLPTPNRIKTITISATAHIG